jgi:hypothetical protein
MQQRRFLPYFFFVLSIIIMPLSAATAYRWGSANGTGAWNGAQTGGLVAQDNAAFDSEELVTAADGSTTAEQIGIFKPAAGGSLTLIDTVKIKGDVEIRFTGSLPVTQHEVFTINIGSPETVNTPVVIAAYNDAGTLVTDFSQLIFNPAQGKTIVVNVYSDVSFLSADAFAGNDPEDSESPGAALPFQITFRGKGSTVFKLPSGKVMYFGPPHPGHGAEGEIEADEELSTTGVHVRVYMEQGSIDAYGNGSTVSPRSQLVFEKWSYRADSINTDLSLDTWITFGQRSSLAYISDNYLGVAEVWDDANTNGALDLGEATLEPAYGSVAFDPSNAGVGRMILQIMRGQLPSGNDFTDAGINVYGALLVPTVFGSSRMKASIFNSDFRTGVYFNQRAGIKAILRITDDVSFDERVNGGDADLNLETWTGRPVGDRRGLVMINHNNSIPHFANNYDDAERIDDSLWAQHNEYEPGFNLGINGIIEIRPHLFLDYIANNSNKSISSSHANLTTHSSERVKKHNPSALFVDGLPIFDKRSARQVDQFGIPISDILYAGYTQAFGAHPVISLQGDAGIFMRSAAAYSDQALTRIVFTQKKDSGTYFLQELPSDDTQVITVALGIGIYDGVYVPVVDEFNVPVMQTTQPDGEYVFDGEATCTIASLEGPLGEPAAGYVCIPSIEIDHAGREVGYANFELWSAWQAWRAAAAPEYAEETVMLPSGVPVVFNEATDITLTQTVVSSRPLDKNKYYSVYDASTLFLNANLILDSVTFIQSDVTRNLASPDVLPQPFMPARPHIVGGELAHFRQSLYPPLIKLYNSTIACHESLVMSGVALTVHEHTQSSLAQSHNTSRIVCYNRGREYDVNGYGRIIQCGSQANVAADEESTSLLLSSAHIDVYRAARTLDATAETPSTIALIMQSAQEYGVDASEKGLHVLYLANGSQVHLGWPTLEGDSSYVPSTMDSVILQQLIDNDPANKRKFRFSSYDGGTGHLQFNGGPFYIGAGDAEEALPPERPIPGIDVDGVVYVNCGGKLSVAPSTDLFIDTMVARRKAALLEATGIIISPRDQVHYLANGGIQNYDIDFATDKVSSGQYENNIVVSVTDPVHIFDVPQLYDAAENDESDPIK